MTPIFYALIFLLFVGASAWLFLSTPAKQLAGFLSKALPIGLVAFGAILVLVGRGAIGLPMAAVGYAWLRRAMATGRIRGAGGTGRQSTVRTAALEMKLDHDTGDMNGLVLSGRHENKWLSELNREMLLDLYAEISQDHESAALLEAYLDRKYHDWREGADTQWDTDHGESGGTGTAQSGAMTKQEAYQILGLEPGASEKEIRSAWRKLMKGMHPDSGGSTFLASKINAARDILLN